MIRRFSAVRVSGCMCGTTVTNSSPPSLATVSLGRTRACNFPAIAEAPQLTRSAETRPAVQTHAWGAPSAATPRNRSIVRRCQQRSAGSSGAAHPGPVNGAGRVPTLPLVGQVQSALRRKQRAGTFDAVHRRLGFMDQFRRPGSGAAAVGHCDAGGDQHLGIGQNERVCQSVIRRCWMRSACEGESRSSQNTTNSSPENRATAIVVALKPPVAPR